MIYEGPCMGDSLRAPKVTAGTDEELFVFPY